MPFIMAHSNIQNAKSVLIGAKKLRSKLWLKYEKKKLTWRSGFKYVAVVLVSWPGEERAVVVIQREVSWPPEVPLRDIVLAEEVDSVVILLVTVLNVCFVDEEGVSWVVVGWEVVILPLSRKGDYNWRVFFQDSLSPLFGQIELSTLYTCL